MSPRRTATISHLEPMPLVGFQKFPRRTPLNLFPGHFYFTKLLLPALFNTPAGRKARVINTTSFVHLFGSSFVGPGLEFDTFKDGPKRMRMGKVWLYGQSKFVRHPPYGLTASFIRWRCHLNLTLQANVIFTQELVRRYGDKIISFAAHPGTRHLLIIHTLYPRNRLS